MLMASPSLQLSEAEYLAIEDAITQTDKGRAFLRMRDGMSRVVGAEQVRQIALDLRDWISGAASASDRTALERIRGDLVDMRRQIDQAKAEIGHIVAAGPASTNGRIKVATAELEEIVNTTAQATNDILTAAEAINETIQQIDGSPNLRDAITARCMEIFQTCGFQDITGQRIAKVVKTLAYIEQRVNAMLAIGEPSQAPTSLPGQHPLGRSDTDRPGGQDRPGMEDASLLNGPQLPGSGLGQDAVDALLDASGCRLAELREPAALSDDRMIATVALAVPAKLDQSSIDALFH